MAVRRRVVAGAAVLLVALLVILLVRHAGSDDPPARVTADDLDTGDGAFWDRLRRGQQLELAGLCKARVSRSALPADSPSAGPTPAAIDAGDLRASIGAALDGGAARTVADACGVAVAQAVAVRGALPRRDGHRQTNATWTGLLRRPPGADIGDDPPVPRAGTVGDPVALLARVDRTFSDAMTVTVLSPGQNPDQGSPALVPGRFDGFPSRSFVEIAGQAGGEDGCRPVDLPAANELPTAPGDFPRCAVVIDATTVVPLSRARARAAMSRPLRRARLDVSFTARGWRFRVKEVRLFPRVTALDYTVVNESRAHRNIVLEGARLPPYRGADSYISTFVPPPAGGGGYVIARVYAQHSGDLAPGARKPQAATLDGAAGVRSGRVALRLEWTSTQGVREEKFATPVSFPLGPGGT